MRFIFAVIWTVTIFVAGQTVAYVRDLKKKILGKKPEPKKQNK